MFKALSSSDSAPKFRWRHAFGREQFRPLLLTFCFSWINGVIFYYLTTFAVNYLVTPGRLSSRAAISSVLAAVLLYGALCPAIGVLADKIGRRPVALLGCAGSAVLGIPAFLALGSGDLIAVGGALALFALLLGLANVTTSLLLVELFPAEIRLTSGSVGFNLAVGPPSGFAPLIGSALVLSTGISFAPSFYLVGVAVVCGLVLFALLPETKHRLLGPNIDPAEPASSPQVQA